jgi:hypothetical protein
MDHGSLAKHGGIVGGCATLCCLLGVASFVWEFSSTAIAHNAATQNASRPATEGIMGVYVAWGFAYLAGAQNQNATWTINLPSSGSNICAFISLSSLGNMPNGVPGAFGNLVPSNWAAQASVLEYTTVGGITHVVTTYGAPVLAAAGVTSVTFHLHVDGSGGPGLGEADVAFAVFTL